MQDLASALGDGVETQVVPGADHFWLGFEREVSTIVGGFFARQLTAPEQASEPLDRGWGEREADTRRL